MKRILFILPLLLALVSCKPKVDPAYLTLLESEVTVLNRQLPMDVGGLSYWLVDLDKGTATLTHSYQFPNNPTVTQDEINVAKLNLIAYLRNTPSERMPLDKGVTLRYKYYSRNRDLLYTITVRPEDL